MTERSVMWHWPIEITFEASSLEERTRILLAIEEAVFKEKAVKRFNAQTVTRTVDK